MKVGLLISVALLSSLSLRSQTYDQENIFHQISHSTVQLICDKYIGGEAAGKIKVKRGRGTAFFCALKIDGKVRKVLVTNKHVIRDADYMEMIFTEANDNGPMFGKTVKLRLERMELWRHHPDDKIDLAILIFDSAAKWLIGEKKRIYSKSIAPSLFAKKDDYLRLFPLDEVVMVGYPKGIIDKHNNTPIFRKGALATSPQLNYNGRKEFLIDIASFQGSSGSPVFMYREPPRGALMSLKQERNLILIGILYAGAVSEFSTGELQIQSEFWDLDQNAKSDFPLNLGAVIKITELEAF